MYVVTFGKGLRIRCVELMDGRKHECVRGRERLGNLYTWAELSPKVSYRESVWRGILKVCRYYYKPYNKNVFSNRK